MGNIKLITFILSCSKIAPIPQGKVTVLSELRRLFSCMVPWIPIFPLLSQQTANNKLALLDSHSMFSFKTEQISMMTLDLKDPKNNDIIETSIK